MKFLEAIILGIIQGLTEFLPISSSGHLELAKIILGIEIEGNVIFTVLLHLATSLSTLVIFRKDIGYLISGIFRKKHQDMKKTGLLLLSSVPVLIIGLLFKDTAEVLFSGQLILVSCCLIITGILLLLTALQKKTHCKKINIWSALIIGISQAIAILPGVSRSGATIAIALLLNIDKKEATRFSFLMVLIPIWGASLLSIKDLWDNPNTFTSDIGVLIIGFLTAFIMGLVSCQWMISLVQKGKIIYFGIYCLVVASLSILYYVIL